MATLPLDKLEKYSKDIDEMLDQQVVRVKDVQRIAGKLNWATAVVTPGRAFVRRLFDAIVGVANPVHFVKLTEGIKEDLKLWQTFLTSFNGKAFIEFRETFTSEDFNLYTDASFKGAGIVMGKWWQQIVFPESWLEHNIATLELYPIVVAVDTFHDIMAGKRVKFHSDNQAVVHVLNSKTSKDKNIIVLVRKLMLVCLRFNVLFEAEHIPGAMNFLPDAISRLQVSREVLDKYGMEPLPLQVKPEWLPENFSF